MFTSLRRATLAVSIGFAAFNMPTTASLANSAANPERAAAAPNPDLPDVSPDRFHRPSDGPDDLPSLNRAKEYLAKNGGGTIVLGARTYHLSGEFDEDGAGLCVMGQGTNATIVVPTTANSAVFRFSASNYCLKNLLISNANRLSGISGIRVAPTMETEGATLSIINDGVVDNVVINGGTDEGIVFRTGPIVDHADSEAYFSTFSNIWVLNAKRALWFENSSHGGRGAGANANTFVNFNVINTGGPVNTGIQIDQGSNEHFVGGSCNGVNVGVTPNPTPTCVLVKQSDTAGGDNNGNIIDGLRTEADTRDWDIRNVYTFGIAVAGLTYSFPNGQPFVWESQIPSAIPYSGPGVYYQTGNQDGALPNGALISKGAGGIFASAGPIIAKQNVSSLAGTTERIENNAMFTIRLPYVGPGYLLSISSGHDALTPYLGYFGCDRSGAPTPTVIAAALVTVSVSCPVITVKNVSGGAAIFKWSLLQMTPN